MSRQVIECPSRVANVANVRADEPTKPPPIGNGDAPATGVDCPAVRRFDPRMANTLKRRRIASGARRFTFDPSPTAGRVSVGQVEQDRGRNRVAISVARRAALEHRREPQHSPGIDEPVKRESGGARASRIDRSDYPRVGWRRWLD
jgi:hypothetical protein